MNKIKNFSKIIVTILLSIYSYSITSGQEDYTKYVDPTIGNVSQFLVPTYPTFSLPNQMIRMFPVKVDYIDDQLTAWPLQVEKHRTEGILKMKVSLGEITPVNLPDKKKSTLIAKGASKENKYIQKAIFNGKVIDSTFFSHKELMDGGTLELTMGNKPNKEWGKNAVCQ